ncbi:hypothetical protein [Paenibacillus sp. VMFN-D1]|uniref:hypothetical protein n=1 Tax=Paenibacillus sp. VMFN-D1 TaxID=2135608 RepID=UPI000E26287D|nr:hypothetical protein [Paenibacillus sp. VMFN-D1]RED34666.1 hypothetical protein C7820_4329 [Paenibacillus sp. VMFN-D1]
MSNRYLTLDGSKKISDTYTLIPAGFDKVQQDVDTNKTTADNHIANADIHVTAAKKAEWDSKAPGSTQTELDEHVENADIHVTAVQKEEWDSKAAGTLQGEVDEHIADTVAHLTQQEHEKLTGIEEGAQKNQNAFVKVNDINASTTTDQFFIVGGIGITITTDPVTKKVTVTATGEATPGPHGSSHDSDGSDPIPDLVELQGVVADQAADIQAASDTAGQALTTAQTAQETADAAQATADAAETPEGAQEKADIAQQNAITISEKYSDDNFYSKDAFRYPNFVPNSEALFGFTNWRKVQEFGSGWQIGNTNIGSYFTVAGEVPTGQYPILDSEPIFVGDGPKTLSADFFSGGVVSGTVSIEIRYASSPYDLIAFLNADPNSDWHRKSVTFNVPSGTPSILVRLACTGIPASGTAAYTRIKINSGSIEMPYSNEIDNQLLFQSVSNGKNAIASAITGKGVPASGSDIFPVLADKIKQIPTGATINVQRGYALIPAGSLFVQPTINAVNVNNSIVNIGFVTGNTMNSETYVKAALTNPTTLYLDRAASSSPYGVDVYWEVIEFVGAKSVQSGTGIFTTDRATITFSAVNPAKSTFYYSYRISAATTTIYGRGGIIQNPTSATLRTAYPLSSTITWYVVEYQ